MGHFQINDYVLLPDGRSAQVTEGQVSTNDRVRRVGAMSKVRRENCSTKTN